MILKYFGLYWISLRNVGWHKFYLSMENSLCDDYITEKFFTILQEYDTVKSECRAWQCITDPTLDVLMLAWVKLRSAILCKLLSHPATSWHQAINFAWESYAIHLHNSSRFVYVSLWTDYQPWSVTLVVMSLDKVCSIRTLPPRPQQLAQVWQTAEKLIWSHRSLWGSSWSGVWLSSGPL